MTMGMSNAGEQPETAPDVKPKVMSPDVMSPDEESPDVMSPDEEGPDVMSPDEEGDGSNS
jgi:hypothetical protein